MDKTICVFVLNLERTPNRRRYAFKQLRKAGYLERVPTVFVRAVDGPDVPQELDDMWTARSGRRLARTEIACALSHVKAWFRARERGVVLTTVLEDDAELVRPAEDLHRYFRELHPDWDVLYLSWEDYRGRGFEIHSDHLLRPKAPMSTVGYVLSRRGLRKMLDKVGNFEGEIDETMANMAERGELKAFACNPPVARHSGLFLSTIVSTIGPTPNAHKTGAATQATAMIAVAIALFYWAIKTTAITSPGNSASNFAPKTPKNSSASRRNPSPTQNPPG